jgi:hypothetical protein
MNIAVRVIHLVQVVAINFFHALGMIHVAIQYSYHAPAKFGASGNI